MNKVQKIPSRVECDPHSRRIISESSGSFGRQSTGIRLMCNRYFHNEAYVHKFKDGENENHHSYPLNEKDSEFVFPEASSDGTIKIFDSWAALTRQDIHKLCPFYDIEKGCLKAQELGILRLEPKRLTSGKYKKQETSKEDTLSNAAISAITNPQETIDKTIDIYAEQLILEVNDAASYVDREIPRIYEAWQFKKAGIPVTIEVEPTPEEAGEDFFASVKAFKQMDKENTKPDITQLGIDNAHLAQMYKLAIEQGLIKPNTSEEVKQENMTAILPVEESKEEVIEVPVIANIVEDVVESVVKKKKSIFDDDDDDFKVQFDDWKK